MNGLWIAALAAGILVAAVASFARESLRCFSRGRLDEACRKRRNPERFGIILRRAVDALIASELIAAIAGGGLAAAAVLRLAAEVGIPTEPYRRTAVASEALVLLAGFVTAFHVLPWTLARVTGERFLAAAWPLFELLIALVKPYVGFVKRFDRFMHRLWGLKEPGGNRAESLMREIQAVVDQGHREGVLASQARRMIERVIALQEEDASAIMTPRTDMDVIPSGVPLEEARRLMLQGGHSRMPVIGASNDDIVGILYAKDLLRHLSSDNGRDLQLKDVVREPFYVPETTGIDKLLESMKRRGVHIAIVVDEYSGVAGLVTMEDILEQIVGDIVDEYDSTEDTGIRQVSPGVLEVEPWVSIDDLDEQYHFDLPDDEDYDTIGGFVYAQLGRIPKKRESLEWKELRLTVLDADKRRIRKLRLDGTLRPSVPAGERPV